LALAVPGATPFPECSGVLVASGEQLRAKAITLSSRKWGQHGDTQFLRLSFGRFGDDLAATATDEQLLAWAVEDLATVFGFDVDIVEALNHRRIDAMAPYGPRQPDLGAALRAGL